MEQLHNPGLVMTLDNAPLPFDSRLQWLTVWEGRAIVCIHLVLETTAESQTVIDISLTTGDRNHLKFHHLVGSVHKSAQELFFFLYSNSTSGLSYKSGCRTREFMLPHRYDDMSLTPDGKSALFYDHECAELVRLEPFPSCIAKLTIPIERAIWATRDVCLLASPLKVWRMDLEGKTGLLQESAKATESAFFSSSLNLVRTLEDGSTLGLSKEALTSIPSTHRHLSSQEIDFPFVAVYGFDTLHTIALFEENESGQKMSHCWTFEYGAPYTRSEVYSVKDGVIFAFYRIESYGSESAALVMCCYGSSTAEIVETLAPIEPGISLSSERMGEKEIVLLTRSNSLNSNWLMKGFCPHTIGESGRK